MITFSILLLAATLIVIWTASGSSNPLDPVRLFLLVQAITVVPFLVVFNFDRDVLQPDILSSFHSQAELDLAIGMFAVYYSVFCTCYVAGSYAAGKISFTGSAASSPAMRRPGVVLLLFAVGFSIALFRIASVGWFDFWQADVARRTLVVESRPALSMLSFVLLAVSCLSMLQIVLGKGATLLRVAILVGLFLAAFAVLLFFGGRKNAVLLAVFGLLAYRLWSGRWPALAISAVFVALIGAAFVLVGELRRSGLQHFEAPDLAGQETLLLFAVIRSTNYVGQYVFIMNEFQPENLWLGEQFLIPFERLFGVVRPPIDDGVLFRNFPLGVDKRTPLVDSSNLHLSSWPPETFGSMYANFHIFGIIAGAAILGAVHRLAFNSMMRSGCSSILLFFYLYILVNFHLSVLRLSQIALAAACLGIVWATVRIVEGVYGYSRRVRPTIINLRRS